MKIVILDAQGGGMGRQQGGRRGVLLPAPGVPVLLPGPPADGGLRQSGFRGDYPLRFAAQKQTARIIPENVELSLRPRLFGRFSHSQRFYSALPGGLYGAKLGHSPAE